MIFQEEELHGDQSKDEEVIINESTSVSKTDLRKVQNHKKKRQGYGNLRKPQA